MLNWLTMSVKASHTVQLLVEVPEEQRIYTCWLRVSQSNIHVPRVYATPRLMGRVLHKWDPQVTYETLTVKEMQNSIKRANDVNGIQEYQKTIGTTMKTSLQAK